MMQKIQRFGGAMFTPGREEDDEIKFFTKADYKEKKAAGKGGNAYFQRASDFLDALGGPG